MVEPTTTIAECASLGQQLIGFWGNFHRKGMTCFFVIHLEQTLILGMFLWDQPSKKALKKRANLDISAGTSVDP